MIVCPFKCPLFSILQQFTRGLVTHFLVPPLPGFEQLLLPDAPRLVSQL
jgi:hypothetical protein